MRNNKKKELHIRVNKPVLKLMLLCVILFLFHFLLYEPIEISKEYITPFSSSEGIENDFWGLMFSGYYVRLEEGEYYITYYGENENPNAYVNVLMDTSELLYEAIYEPGQSIRITIPEGIHTVEPRMYWRAGGNTAVESIRIEPVFTPLFCIKHGCIYFLIAFVIIGLHIVCNEKETKKSLSNIIKNDEFIKHEKGLKNASMNDRNDNKIEGDNIKIGKLAKLSNDIKIEIAASAKQNNK